MSWSFFNKRKPVFKTNVDREFEREVAKSSQLETNARKLYKDMKRYNESQIELSKAESKIAQDLCSLPTGQERLGQSHAEDFEEKLKGLENYRKELITNIVKTNIEPMKKLSSVFQNVNNGVKKREQCLQEYSRLKAKVDKYKERLERDSSPQNVSKLKQYEDELESAQADYEAHNEVMLEELPDLWQGRVTYFEPCFDALQQSQVDYYSKCCQTYGDMVDAMNDDGADEAKHDDLQEMLSEFRTLSIVGHE